MHAAHGIHVSRRPVPAPDFHLLEVGVSWPPETFLLRRLQGLIARGMRATVVSDAGNPGFELPGVTFIPIGAAHGRMASRVLGLARHGAGYAVRHPDALRNALRDARRSPGRASTYLESRGVLAGIDADIVHFQWNSAAIRYLDLFDAWHRPIVISCRGEQVSVRPLMPDESAFREQLRESLNRASAVHCVSQAMQREVLAYGVPRERITVITPAVDPEVFRPSASERVAGGLQIVSVGSLIWRKGWEYALRAFRGLADRYPDATFHIVGDGNERARVLFTIHDLDLQSQVRLHGKLSPDRVLALLQSSDIYLFASHSEGIANSVLEAMSCGLPCVTSDCGGMSEVITSGRDGYLVAPRDVDAMAAALHTLAEDPDLRRRIGGAARARILEAFRLDQQVDAFCVLYDRLRRMRT